MYYYLVFLDTKALRGKIDLLKQREHCCLSPFVPTNSKLN